MNKIIITLFICLLLTHYSFAQSEQTNTIYIIDSIPVLEDPENGNEIKETDVSDITVVKNRDSLNKLGYEKLEAAIYIFTKEYRNRDEAVKRVPSSKQMERKNGVWLFHGNTYSGPFIDYYYSGRKQGEGMFKDGKVDGLRKAFYQNGNISMETQYSIGLENGLSKEYYEDGSLQQKGEFASGKETGIWESYYPNGQVELRSTYQEGELVDSAFKYYSNGKIKERVVIKNGKVNADPSLSKIFQLMAKGNESNKQGDTKAAIKYCSRVIELDSTYADAFFSRGTIRLNDFQFEEAIKDFDKALLLEPYMPKALTNRAFARIRKHQFANSRQLSKSNGISVLASKDNPGIPENELSLICGDLKKAISLGDKGKMIADAISEFCKSNN